jgi:hypothetical protein
MRIEDYEKIFALPKYIRIDKISLGKYENT